MSYNHVNSGDDMLLRLTLFDGDTGQFPQAIVRDSADADVAGSPFDLTHDADGFYTGSFSTPADDNYSVEYIVYSDAGHTTINTRYSQVMENQEVSQSTDKSLFQDGAVWVDSFNGSSGTTGTFGTSINPVASMSDAKTIADANNITRFKIKGSVTVSVNMLDYTFEGTGNNTGQYGTLQINSGLSLRGSTFIGLSINFAGAAVSDSEVINYINCDISFSADPTFMHMNCKDCRIESNRTIGLWGGSNHFDNCNSDHPVAPVIFDLDDGSVRIIAKNWNGNVRWVNANASQNDIQFSSVGGHIDIQSSCTNGTYDIYGTAQILDNSTGSATVNDYTDESKTEADARQVLLIAEHDSTQVDIAAVDAKIDIIDTNVDDIETLANTIDGKVDLIETKAQADARQVLLIAEHDATQATQVDQQGAGFDNSTDTLEDIRDAIAANAALINNFRVKEPADVEVTVTEDQAILVSVDPDVEEEITV